MKRKSKNNARKKGVSKRKKVSAKDRVLPSNKIMIVLVCCALITVGMVLLFFSLFAIYKVYEIDMVVDVSERNGINTDTDMVNFGKISQGGSSTRTIVMTHEHSKPLIVHFKASGNISRLVSLPENFFLDPGLSKEADISVHIPRDSPDTSYEGKLTVYFRRI